MADFFEPSPKTPERKPNNSNPPNIKEERNRKRKASTTVEKYHETFVIQNKNAVAKLQFEMD